MAPPPSPRNPFQGNRLASLRVAAGIDRASLAARCAVDERTVLAWESGERSIPEGQLALLTDLFGVSARHLLGHDGGDEDEGNGDDGNGDVAA